MEMRNMCFVCLKTILSEAEDDHDCHGESEVNQKEKYSRSSVKILISYVLNSSASGNCERDKKLHGEILSSFEKRKFSLCPECLLKAEHLLKLHLELEKIQMRILDALRNLQCDFARKESKFKDDFSGDRDDGGLFRLRDLVLQGFTRRKLSDKALVRLERFNIAGFKHCSVQVPLFPEEEEQHPDVSGLENVPVLLPLPLSTSPLKHELEDAGDPDGGEGEQACLDGDVTSPSPLEKKDDDDDYEHEETTARTTARTSTRKSLERKVKQRRLDARKTKKKSDKDELSNSGSDSDPERSKDDQCDIDIDTDGNYIPENDEDASDMKTKTHPSPQIRPKKPGCWDCDICLEYIPPEDFQFHLKTHPEFEKIYTCVLCPPDQLGRASKRFFGTYKGLVWHYIRCNHRVQLSCKLCPDQSILYPRSRLCKHLYGVHHLNSNHNKIPCKYINCPKEFYDPYSRAQHHRRQHLAHAKEKKYKCEICGAGFTYNSGRTTHLRGVHGVKSVKGKIAEGVRVEKRSRKKKRKLKCDYCPESFYSKLLWQDHQRIHTGDMNYKCDVCQEVFVNKRRRNYHRMKAHGIAHFRKKKKAVLGDGVLKKEEERIG